MKADVTDATFERVADGVHAFSGAAALGDVPLAQVLGAMPDVVALKDRAQRYLFVNGACAAVLGREPEAIIGRSDDELYPPTVAAALRAVDQEVMATGQTRTVTEWVPSARDGGALRAWTSVKAPLRDAAGTIVGVIVTARDETARYVRERQDQLLVALDEAIRPLGEPDAIMQAATELLGRALDAGRSNYTEIDEGAGALRVRQNFTQRGMPSVVGTYRLDDFATLLPSFRAGAPVVIADTRADPRTAPIVALPELDAVKARAMLDVPLVRHGVLVGVLSVNHPTPRAWRDDEVALVRAVAERTWRVLDQARAARALAAREAQLRTMLDTLPTLAWTARADGYIDEYNARWYEYTGTTPAEMEGWGWQRVHDPAVLPAVLERWRASIATGAPFEMTFPLRGADGVYRDFLTRVAPVRDAAGAVVRWVGTNTDLSPERAAAAERERLLAVEQAAREAAALEERRLAAVLAALPVGVIVADAPSGQLRYANRAVHAIWGHAPPSRALTEYSVEWVGYHVDADGRATDRRYASTEWPLARALLTGATVQDEPIDAERPDGQRRRILASAAPIRDAAGAIVGGVVTITDMSDAARAREALETARVAAEQANRAKSEFLANMSHELRTPLNAIQGHVQLLDLELHGPVTEAQRGALARVQRAQQHLLGLINDVLNYAKLEAGKVEFDLRPVTVRDVVRDVLPLIEPQLLAKGLTLVVDLPAERGEPPVWIRADREKLGQVLLNLLANAVKFTPAVQGPAAPTPGAPGRITVDVVPILHDGTQAAVRVHDTGIGIATEKQATIFDPFVQVSAGFSRATEGTGLGLAISRELARGMGGDLIVESTVGAGSTFSIVLPRAAAPASSD